MKFLKKVFNKIRKVISRLKILKEQPLEKQKIIKVNVGKYKILANSSHTIERNLLLYKYYSRNLPRIALKIKEKYSNFSIIDIGANIGDTVALIRSAGLENKIFCIEGLKYYYNLLNINLANFKNVIAFNFFLGDKKENINSEIFVNDGTARIGDSKDEKKQSNLSTLDEICINNNISDVKLIKIDTDGYDFKIVRGGLDFIKKYHPILFLEYDNVYLSNIKESGLETLGTLLSLGYRKILYYDNFGKFLCSADLDNKILIEQLYNYIKDYSGAFYYYDICILNEDDNDLADAIIKSEMNFFK